MINTVEARKKTSKMLWGIIFRKRCTQKDIARELQINVSSISQYITEAKTPTLQNFLKIQNYYESLSGTRENTNGKE